MSMRTQLAGYLLAAAVAILGGCAHEPVVVVTTDADVARLPASDRSAIVAAQQRVDVADANVAAAQAGVDDATKFSSVTYTEVDAARTKLSATQSSLDLHRQANDSAAFSHAKRAVDAAEKELSAALAKQRYAGSLVSARRATLDERVAAQQLASVNVQLAKSDALARRGFIPAVDRQVLTDERSNAQVALAQARQRAGEANAEADSLRSTWETRFRAYDVATRSIAPTPPPRAPEPLPQR
jgi:hypothetical protein